MNKLYHRVRDYFPKGDSDPEFTRKMRSARMFGIEQTKESVRAQRRLASHDSSIPLIDDLFPNKQPNKGRR